jgi:putative flippase GtrA
MLIPFLITGVLTTLTNYAVYFLAIRVFYLHYIAANIIAWVAAVAFAYVVNRKWVFKSKSENIPKEAGLFVLSRLFSLLMETPFLIFAIEFLNLNEFIAKVAVAFVVVASNFITGKILVFKR